MSQNTNQIVVAELQKFIIDNFIKNCYNEDDENFQIKQFEAVCNIIKRLCDKYSVQALEALFSNWRIPIVPSIQAVGGHSHMQNIGTSAFMCLQKMRERPAAQTHEVMSCIHKFLSRVQQEAQNASAKYVEEAKKKPVSSDLNQLSRELSIETFGPFIEEYNNFLISKKAEFEAAKKDIECLYEAAKEELGQISAKAKASAEDAEKNAQDIKQTVTEIVSKLEKETVAATQATKSAEAATDAAKVAAKAATNAEETSRNMLPNMLSALGIFIGIVVAVMACYLSILLTPNGENAADLECYSRPFEFMQYLLMGHITCAVVFLLMFLISRITGNSLACSCKHFCSDYPDSRDCDCWTCKNKCSIPVRFMLRYPYLFGINLICFLGYIVLALWQFVNLYYRAQVNAWILTHRCYAVGVVVLALVIICVVLFFIFRFKKTEKTNKK